MGTPALSRSQSSPHQNLHQQQSVPNNYRQVGFQMNPFPADHDYCRFESVLLVNQITAIGNEMFV